MIKITTIKKDDTYYVQQRGVAVEGRWIINGKIAEHTLFDKAWLKIDEAPTSLEVVRKSRQVFKHFKLSDEFEATARIPAIADLEFFGLRQHLGEPTKNARIFDMYERVYDEIPEQQETIEAEFVIVDEDAELIVTAFPIVPQFPVSLEFHPVSFYKYPCSVTSKELLKYIKAALKDHITTSGYTHLTISADFDDWFRVVRSVKVIHEEGETVLQPKGRKTVEVIKPLREIASTVLSISAIPRDVAEFIAPLSADNYFALKTKADELVAQFTTRLDAKDTVCPTCHGYGVIVQPAPAG